MRKRFFILLILVFLATASQVASQTRSVVWNRWDVVIDNVDTVNNRYDVTEIYDLSFTGTFRFGQREIERTNLDNIANISVTEAGRSLISDCSGAEGTYCVTNTANGIQIEYIFRQPITNSGQTFEISYTVEGALRSYDDGDQLWWIAIPDEHFGFPILQSTITVQMPTGFAPREGIDPVVTYGATSNVSVNGTTVVARATEGIRGDQYFDIRVQYPHNPDMELPSWQSRFDQSREQAETMQQPTGVVTWIIRILFWFLLSSL